MKDFAQVKEEKNIRDERDELKEEIMLHPFGKMFVKFWVLAMCESVCDKNAIMVPLLTSKVILMKGRQG